MIAKPNKHIIVIVIEGWSGGVT